MNEHMVPGDYTALGVVNIRLQMKTSPSTNIVGAYTSGIPFRVYQVYDEADGILWGRVSSNTGDGKARYVALRVNNNEKAKLETPAEVVHASGEPLVDAINGLTHAINSIALKFVS